MKYTATLSPVQVGQAVKSLILLGEKKITIEETEKDRFVVTTTNETAHSKKVISGNLSGHAHDKCGASFHLRNHEEHPEASQRFLWPH